MRSANESCPTHATIHVGAPTCAAATAWLALPTQYQGEVTPGDVLSWDREVGRESRDGGDTADDEDAGRVRA